jgi:hypothetical protein
MRGGKIVGKPGCGNFFTVNRAVVDSVLFHPFAPVASPHISQGNLRKLLFGVELMVIIQFLV